MFTTIWIQRVSNERGPSRMRAALLVAAGLLLLGPTRAMMLPRDPARLAAIAAAAAAAEYDTEAVAARANWPVDDPPLSGLTKEEEAHLLRMLLQVAKERHQRQHQHQQDEHDAAIDAALEAARPLLEAADIGAAASRIGDAEHTAAHAPDDKRNFRALVPTLCHFKICNMGRKRNSPPDAGAAAWPSL